MSALLAVLFPWLACDPADLDRFPASHVCQEQLLRCAEHRERLRTLRGIHGWQGGRWDNALADLDFSRRYWLCLTAAHDVWWVEPAAQRRRLLVLKELIGDVRYRDGWRPILIPDAGAFRPPGPMPRANP